MLFVMNTLSIFYGYFIVSTFKTFGQQHFKSDEFLTATGAFASVMGGMRWIWSYFYDRYSYKLTYGVLLIMQIILSGVISFTNTSKAAYFICVSLSLFCEGGHFTLSPAVTKVIFGRRGSDVYGIMLIYPGLANIISSVLVSQLLKTYGYPFFYYLGCGFTVLAFLLLLCF